MKITRTGAQRNRGVTTIIKDISFKTNAKYSWENNVQWDAKTREVVIRPRWIEHTDGVTHHNYSIRLNLDDVTSLLGLLGHVGFHSDAEILRKRLAKHLPAIIKLLSCAAGLSEDDLASKKPRRKRGDAEA